MNDSVKIWLMVILFVVLYLLVAFGIGKLSQKVANRFTDRRKAKIIGYSVFVILSVIISYYSIQDFRMLKIF